MSILDDTKYTHYYSLIYDWILSPPTQKTIATYHLHHGRLRRHVAELTKKILHMFFVLTVESHFTILRTQVRILDELYEVEYKEIRVEEESLDMEREHLHSEMYYAELLQHDTQHDIYEIEALLEDNAICKYTRGWIGFLYKELWPFISFPRGEYAPGVYPWKEGKRILHMIEMVPIVSISIDELYS